MAISKSFIKYTIWTTLRTIYILFGNSKLSLKKHLKKKNIKRIVVFFQIVYFINDLDIYKQFG